MSESFVYGLHAVTALLTKQHRVTKRLFVKDDRADKRLADVLALAKQYNVPVEALSIQDMNDRFPDVSHQGVIASANPLPDYSERDIKFLLSSSQAPYLILILDGITDPHNLGACLRSADAAGVNFVMMPKDKNAAVTPVVSKVACGAAESVPVIRVTNLARAMDTLKQAGVWIYGAAGEADGTLYQMDGTGSVAVVMGAEGHGLRRLTREQCDGLFSLPMQGAVTSLNVSVATGITLYEVLRQRMVVTALKSE